VQKLSMVAVMALTAAGAAFISSAAHAAHFKTGLWKDIEYQESNGKRIPCHLGSCIQLTIPANLDAKLQAEMAERQKQLDQVCVSTDILQGFAEQTLAAREMMMGSRFKNCKTTDPVTSEKGYSSGMICDDITLNQSISYPDDEHLTLTMIVKGTAESGPSSGGMTMVATYEWVSPDCGNATTVIRENGEIANVPR